MTVVRKILFDSSNMSAFGTLETNELEPIFQGDFVYGLNTQLWNTAVVSGAGAAVDTNSGRLRIQSGTANGGYAYITSRRIVRYRAGQGVTARFTPLFTTGVANNLQYWGVGTVASNTLFDGYYIGYNGTSLEIAHYISGTRNAATSASQSNWNGDKINGTAGTSFTYDPTKGTPFMIKYPYLGYGDILFFAQVPSTGAWTLLHTIQYANTVATTEVSNPSLQFVGFTSNSAAVSNMTMFCGSVGIFLSGERSFTSNPKWAVDNSIGSTTTENCVLNIKNCTTYNTVTNRGLIRLNSISCSNSANTTAFIRLKVNATIGGTPSYATISGTTADSGTTITNGNSITSFDISGTTVSGGTYIFNIQMGPGQNQFVDLTPYDLFVAPTEILTISSRSLANSTVGVSLNWSEDI